MITISRISKQYYIDSILNCKNDIKWFYDTLSKCKGKNTHFILKNGNTEIGLLVNYFNLSNKEIGICIYNKYKYQGFGTNVVIQIVQKFNSRATFRINKHNINSILFFSRLIKQGHLDFSNIKIVN